jgi:glycogen(starch) synthase
MRLLEATHRYPPALGGVEIQAEGVANGLSRRGYEVEVATTDLSRDRPLERLPDRPSSGPVRVHRHRAVSLGPAPHGLGLVAPGLGLQLLRTNADVVHAHGFGMAPTRQAAAMRRLRRVPLVVETHLDPGRATPGWWAYARAMAAWTLTPAARVVGHTTQEVKLLASLGVPAEKLACIPTGIALEEFSDAAARSVESPAMTVLFVGRLDPERKGLVPLLEALAGLPAPTAWTLRMVGPDWNGGAAVVEAQARALGIAARVTLTGPVSRPALLDEYRSADLFVLPSTHECTPIVLMEAMAAGLPIVTTRVGGVSEVVDDGQNASLCRPGDPGELRTAIAQLLADPELRARFGRSGRSRVQRLSWDRILPLWDRLFRDVIGRAG